MRWQGGRRGGNIEDRRGMSAAGVGGIGLGGLALALIGYFVFGIDPSTTMSVVQGGGQAEQQEGVRGTTQDQGGQFVDVIEQSTTDVWTQIFAAEGQRYQRPASIVIYDQATGTGCGMGQSAMGPFYCPADRKIYLDLAFWNELESRFGAKGEAARAYVIAHEVGHHIQNLTGATNNVERGSRGADSSAVRLELQADCYAGVWVARAPAASGGQVALDPADIEDGIRAAAAVGDDAIQKQSQGRVMPDAFTHGSSEQRMRWFRIGVEKGDPAACDTFKAARL
ncbi:flagellar biosynthesis protein FlgM [Phenylobacterium sp. Root77]|uniref:KPN_02809 family neutral zinc metallopeptidase n=1 Tax=unclassified Phenylobacterium TaxID=2640670 RepID=UPI0006FF9785|nr:MULTISPECIES: neutral zinc metallopeptidase [unclassified Phenylobacterium]KQW72981.1 flagellar biosynthesis protein FlgM [Phenylobacterium sp. Root1277]KQW92200.1 flagellar biosynthesis protein FlgM [Phenylobacterium sp. Root1290]KRC40431.1 flagellar biosynthesis protein FlgM [Phenylobacterium sp. Root77]